MVSGRWIVRVISATILLLGAAAALNLLINPYRLYASELVPPLAVQPRNDKYKLMSAYPEQGQILLLGSSRMRLMSPTLVTELTGLRAFNATVSRTMPRDYVIFSRFAFDIMQPQQIVAGIDLQVLHPTIEWDNGTWLNTSPLRAFADGYVPPPSLEQQLGSLLSLQQVMHSIESLVRAIQTPEQPFPYNDDGSIKAELLPADENVERGNGEVYDPEFWQSFTQLDAGRLNELKTLFSICAEKEIVLTIVLLPFDSRALETLQLIPNFNERLADYLGFLEESRQLYGIRIVDFTDPERFGGDGEAFDDYYHPLRSTTDLLTRALFATAVVKS